MNALVVALGSLLVPRHLTGHRPINWAAIIRSSWAAFSRVVTELGLTGDQRRAAVAPFLTELVRVLPRFVTVVAVTSLLPLIADRARNRFRAAGESAESAEDLAQAVVARILHAFFGSWPRGNVGALVASIARSEHCDHLRARAREGEVLERVRDAYRAVGN
ncbi:rna polymerase sigma70 : [Gemmata massiliana]|uniref:Rna polymerase sigma70 n=1 Tax=Gemmata massiliana TaxID=1210884 RepID=A0A6P2CU22_9BACT|nr:hypothetical protein [Gemmata massiliana]VTR91645.1 rna polymerase sigma70 : [Gemmata massiliana]